MADLDKLLYDVNVTCPVCSHAFKAPKVRKSALIPDGRHADFYVQYRGFDPTDYSVWQCPDCGYANADASFTDVNPAERHVLKEALQQIEPLTIPRERDVATVIALFERAIFSAQARNSHSRMAGLFLRVAWVHRREGSAAEEQVYLAKAFDAYLEAYQNEPFPLGKMSELTVLYLLGELARRLGRYGDAVQYFAGVTQARDHQEPQIVNMAKEQWELARREAEEAEAAEPVASEAAEAPVAGEAAAATPEVAATAQTAAASPPTGKPVLTGFSIQSSQLEWLQAVSQSGGGRLDRNAVLQAVLAAVQHIAPERLSQPTTEQLRQAVQQELARGR